MITLRLGIDGRKCPSKFSRWSNSLCQDVLRISCLFSPYACPGRLRYQLSGGSLIRIQWASNCRVSAAPDALLSRSLHEPAAPKLSWLLRAHDTDLLSPSLYVERRLYRPCSLSPSPRLVSTALVLLISAMPGWLSDNRSSSTQGLERLAPSLPQTPDVSSIDRIGKESSEPERATRATRPTRRRLLLISIASVVAIIVIIVAVVVPVELLVVRTAGGSTGSSTSGSGTGGSGANGATVRVI